MSKGTEQVLNFMYLKMTSDILLLQLSLLLLNSRLISKSHKPVTVSWSKMKSGSHCQTFAFGVHFTSLSFCSFFPFFFFFWIPDDLYSLFSSKNVHSSTQFVCYSTITDIHNLHCGFKGSSTGFWFLIVIKTILLPLISAGKVYV